MENLNDRMAINLTMLLTAMAFKWVLSDMLPKVPYLTVMEKYVVMTFMLLFVQGLWFWIASSFHATLCRDEHWIYGALPISSSTGGGENGGGRGRGRRGGRGGIRRGERRGRFSTVPARVFGGQCGDVAASGRYRGAALVAVES